MALLLQILIASVGVLAVWLVFSQGPRRRWAPWLGLLGQPAWLIATYAAGDWGEFIAAVAFTVAWARGARQEGWPWKRR